MYGRSPHPLASTRAASFAWLSLQTRLWVNLPEPHCPWMPDRVRAVRSACPSSLDPRDAKISRQVEIFHCLQGGLSVCRQQLTQGIGVAAPLSDSHGWTDETIPASEASRDRTLRRRRGS